MALPQNRHSFLRPLDICVPNHFFFVVSLRAEILKYNYRPSTTWQNNMFSANNLHQKSLIALYTMSHGEKHDFNVGESAFSVSR